MGASSSYLPTTFSRTDDFPDDWDPTTTICGKLMSCEENQKRFSRWISNFNQPTKSTIDCESYWEGQKSCLCSSKTHPSVLGHDHCVILRQTFSGSLNKLGEQRHWTGLGLSHSVEDILQLVDNRNQ
jgi:hypothetical protein